MKKYLSILAVIVFLQTANAQENTNPQNSPKTKTCFDEYYEAFTTRGATPVTDGEHNVVFSAIKGDSCVCGEAKVIIKDGLLIPSFQVKKTDGTYEPAKKVLHPKTTKGENADPKITFSVYKGMSSTFLTEDLIIVNLFFIDNLKRQVVPNAQAPSPNDIAGVQIVLNEKEKEIIKQAYDGLSFETGKAKIKSSSYPHLNVLASMLQEKPEYKMQLVGYTDNVGKPETNLALSKSRAEAVKKYFVSKGVDAARITAEGFGIDNPIGDNNTPEGRAKNRRVEFIMVK